MKKPLHPVSKENLTQKIYDSLLGELLSNQLVPGTLIDRKALAAKYNVSIAPVRDALQRLSLEGFVETKSRSATIVKSIRKEDIYGILKVREALESEVVRMICGKTIISEKKTLLDMAQKVDSSENLMDYWRLDISFHRYLVGLSKCTLLINMYNQIMNIGNFYQINNYFVNLDPKFRESHVKLVNDLFTTDKNKAEKVLRAHLNAGKTKHYA